MQMLLWAATEVHRQDDLVAAPDAVFDDFFRVVLQKMIRNYLGYAKAALLIKG